jgi:hypothetical protein
MPRRVTVLSLAAALVAAAVPAAAQAADTYTVDGAAAGPGCDGARLCKTLGAAVAAVAAGDTIIVRPGTYTEAGKITLTKKNVNIQGTAGSTTVTTTGAAVGDATITLVEGDILDGITITPATNAGPGVLVTGRSTTVKNTAIVRLAASSEDTAAYLVDPGVAAGTSTLQRVTILNGPAGAAGRTAPAVLGNASSSLAISDSVILSGAQQGAAVGIIGSDTSVVTPVANTIVRSSLVAGNAAADALTVTSAATSSAKKVVTLDTAVLLGGSAASGVKLSTVPGPLAGQDSPGDIQVTANHVTVTGAKQPFLLDAAAGGQTPVGNLQLTFDRSIVHGTGAGTVASFVPATPIGLISGVANTARVTITGSDTNTPAAGANSGNATITVTGSSSTPDAALFVNAAKQNIHLRGDAPVIDKAGAAVAGESATDIDGQPRQTGAATDIGADEFLDRAPTALVSVSPQNARQDQAVGYDGSRSFDPDGVGSAIVRYHWVFGDGAVLDTPGPATTHAFSRLGLYNGTLTVYDAQGAASPTVAIPPVAVSEGTAPVVKITAPTKNGAYAITAREKVGKRIKRVLDPVLVAKVLVAGTATDASGIKGVQLSVRRVAIGTAKAPAAPKTCVYLDGKTHFKTASCRKPVFFAVQVKSGRWSYRLKKALRPKAGLYELAARATDGSGILSAPVTVRFRLK